MKAEKKSKKVIQFYFDFEVKNVPSQFDQTYVPGPFSRHLMEYNDIN